MGEDSRFVTSAVRTVASGGSVGGGRAPRFAESVLCATHALPRELGTRHRARALIKADRPSPGSEVTVWLQRRACDQAVNGWR